MKISLIAIGFIALFPVAALCSTLDDAAEAIKKFSVEERRIIASLAPHEKNGKAEESAVKTAEEETRKTLKELESIRISSKAGKEQYKKIKKAVLAHMNTAIAKVEKLSAKPGAAKTLIALKDDAMQKLEDSFKAEQEALTKSSPGKDHPVPAVDTPPESQRPGSPLNIYDR